MKGRKGFTIIELIIVIAVISILIGIALPRFRGMQEAGYIAQAKGELRTLQTAVESYYIHNDDTLPGDLDDLTDDTPNIIGEELPTDPFDPGEDYGYSTSGNYYIIYSVGPGGDGSASVDDEGEAEDEGNAIYVTNGSPRDTSP